MADFYRFPHTPHLAWLGKGQPRGDKVLPPSEAQAILAGDVVVEEKVDGANVGFSLDANGVLRAQNRGNFISRGHCHAQFKPLFRWLQGREQALTEALGQDLMLFGEWCYAVHSVRYTRLPDWFLAFDVYDRKRDEFWNVEQRDGLVQRLGLTLVPRLGEGHYDMQGLMQLLGRSLVAEGPAEGLYVRRHQDTRLLDRAKLVRAEFVQEIDEHWSKRSLQENALSPEAVARLHWF